MLSRILLRSVNLAVLRPYHRCHHRRHFSLSPRVQAEELSDTFLAKFKNTPSFSKLADKPDALKALLDFAKLLEEHGVDLSGGKPPSMIQMFRLTANPTLREAAKLVAVELKKAGIDITPQDAIGTLVNMKKDN